MFKQSLCAVAIISAMSGVALADDYTYVAGGLQVGGITNKSDFDKLVHQNRPDQSKPPWVAFTCAVDMVSKTMCSSMRV